MNCWNGKVKTIREGRSPASRLLLCFLAGWLLFTACRSGEMARGGNFGQHKPVPLQFDAGGKFRIAQFTDIHWTGSEPEQCAAAGKVIRHVLETERPHLAVLTGDIVIAPQEAGWSAVMALFAEAKVPVAVTLGNHDDEAEWTREEIFRYLSSYPGFLSGRGPASVSGVGNGILEVRPGAALPSGLPAALLYFFDSHAYAADTAVSYYAWINFDQIAWYREQSRFHTARNRGVPLPALAFFHIPLPEYAEVALRNEKVGVALEEVCAPKINSGLLTSLVEMKEVMGTFAGHDHVNNFIGIHKGVALAYGQKTGFSSYGNLDKGARIIELQEGKRGFTSWIRTEKGVSGHFVFPAP